MIFHTDHGNTYQNNKLHEICVEKIRQSMSSKGVSKENGLIENFFNLLKQKCGLVKNENIEILET